MLSPRGHLALRDGWTNLLVIWVFVSVLNVKFWCMTNSMAILTMMSDSTWPSCSQAIFGWKVNMFAHISYTTVARVFVSVVNMRFWSMMNQMSMLLIISSSKWPPGGHIFVGDVTFLPRFTL